MAALWPLAAAGVELAPGATGSGRMAVMQRRNRVDPWGDLHAVAARGMLTGNRGCLVNAAGDMVRHAASSLWISCRTEFRGWRHPVAAPRTWTPLFFLDDAVALAAGHRPCATCRRDDYRAYRSAVTAAEGAPSPLFAWELNQRLRDQRHRPGRGMARAADRRLWDADASSLPTGTVVVNADGTPCLLLADRVLCFGFDGWHSPADRPSNGVVRVLTPRTSVAALARGFRPLLHRSARP